MTTKEQLGEIAFKALSELDAIIPDYDGPVPEWNLTRREIQARRVITNAKLEMAKVSV